MIFANSSFLCLANTFGDMMSQTAQLSTNGRKLSVRRMHSS
ncbi:Uncharacterised protein [Segatella copri]|nr:Uncharacterised protein [Segatella copri]